MSNVNMALVVTRTAAVRPGSTTVAAAAVATAAGKDGSYRGSGTDSKERKRRLRKYTGVYIVAKAAMKGKFTNERRSPLSTLKSAEAAKGYGRSATYLLRYFSMSKRITRMEWY